MMRRFGAILVLLAIAATPVSREACQIACAARAMHPHHAQAVEAQTGSHHSDATPACHRSSGPGPAVTADPASCDHGDTATAASVVTMRTDTVAAAPACFFEFAPHAATTTYHARGWDNRAIDRLEPRLAVPLRI